MIPRTRNEMQMERLAGTPGKVIPEARSREECFYHKMIEKDSDASSEERMRTAIAAYLDSHDADVVTEAELADALDAKAAASHSHAQSDITGLSDALAGKAAVSHSHAQSDITGLADTLDAKAAASHSHAQGDITGLADALDAKAAASHSHAQSDITGLADALAGKAAASHSHAQSDITGLADALDAKAAASHSHAQSDITGLADALAGKAAASHTHDDRYYTEAETDTALSGKAAASHSHDDRYYTETETDTKLGGKSNTGHTHDDRYYTETEVDTLLSGKADSTDIPDVTAFITRAVNDLTNYYTKSETYTQSEIDSMVSAIPKFAIEVVSALPVADISATTVYLLTSQTQEQGNLYTEYIYVGGAWELLGSQTVDLSGYYTSAQIDALLSGLPVAGHTHDDRYYTETEIDGMVQTLNTAVGGKAASSHTHDDRYYTETETDSLLSGKSNTGHSHDAATTAAAGFLSASDKTKLDGIAAGAQVNVKPDWNAAPGTAAEILNKPANLVQDANYTHTESNFTAVEKTKLAGIAAGAQVNQNAFSNVKVGGTTVAADAKQDTIELVAGNNITITPDATNDMITFSATDTTYSAATTSTAGLMSAADKTKLDGIEAATSAPGKVASASAQGTSTNYARKDHTHGIDIATGDSNGQVKIAGTNVSVKGLGSMAYKGCLVCTQAQYNAATKDSQTIYLITG